MNQSSSKCKVMKFYSVLFILYVSNLFNLTLAYTNGFHITKFISSYGYDVETHSNIQTEDGYLLDMFRIPHGKNFIYKNNNSRRPAVLLMHGLMVAADVYVISGPENGLAFILADAGYDVWLGNARGTIHSRKHITLNPDFDKKFWEFSWNEIGVYDLPAKIDYILDKTKHRRINYIGHSQGCSTFFVMGSERPSYNDKITLMVGLAPPAYIKEASHPFIKLAKSFFMVVPDMNSIYSLIGDHEFVPNEKYVNQLAYTLCKLLRWRNICAQAISIANGNDLTIDTKLVPMIAETCASGASFRQFYHFMQITISGKFRKYDFGPTQNLAVYGTIDPPSYNVSKIDTPIALFYGPADSIVSIEGVKQLASELPNVVKTYRVPRKNFTHNDFLYAPDVVNLVYLKVIEVMSKFN